jgi:hypothetical protein
LDKNNYKLLTNDESTSIQQQTTIKIVQLIKKYKHKLDKESNKCFERKFNHAINNEEFRTSRFYIMPKIHKDPWQTRPIVSCIGSSTEVLSVWLDVQLQKVIKLCLSYIEDSIQVITELNELSPLPKGATIFSADATSMYTNIDIDHGLESIKLWLERHQHEFPKDFPPIELICEGLELVMKNNIFEFGETTWHQLQGTAMGTSVAPTFATIYYAYHEETAILNSSIKPYYYKRKIDDTITIMLDYTNIKHKEFMNIMNNFSNGKNKSLEWIATKPSATIDFLDLTIKIEPNGTINTKTYQKKLNLYLYIPPKSAHPPGVLKGLIYGNIRKFWLQNSDKKDFRILTKNFYNHLCNRGHKSTEIKNIFISAAKHIQKQLLKNNKTEEPKQQINKIYLHVPYHPQQMSRQQLQESFKTSCKNILHGNANDDTTSPNTTSNNLMNVAYSRPKNIRDLICRTKLPKNSAVLDSINEIQNTR